MNLQKSDISRLIGGLVLASCALITPRYWAAFKSIYNAYETLSVFNRTALALFSVLGFLLSIVGGVMLLLGRRPKYGAFMLILATVVGIVGGGVPSFIPFSGFVTQGSLISFYALNFFVSFLAFAMAKQQS